MRKVPAPKVVTAWRRSESPLPAQIQEALGELVGAAREGLLALSVGVGLGVVHELMELEVDEVVGPKGKHDPDRVAMRHGHEDGSMTLGGRRVPVRRPRMRTADDEHELPVADVRVLRRPRPADAGGDGPDARRRLDAQVRAGRRAGRQRGRGRRLVDVEDDGVGAVHRAHPHRARGADVAPAGRRAPGGDDARRPGDRRAHARRRARASRTEGVKIPLGLWEGSTENATLARTLLADLVDRGLDPEQAILFVIDGGKALRRAIKDVFGEHALVHRCHRHKERNVSRSAARARPRPGPRPDARGVVADRRRARRAAARAARRRARPRRGPTPPARCAKACPTR